MTSNVLVSCDESVTFDTADLCSSKAKDSLPQLKLLPSGMPLSAFFDLFVL